MYHDQVGLIPGMQGCFSIQKKKKINVIYYMNKLKYRYKGKKASDDI